jgi:adenine phosphoribosyltransferase
MIRRPRAGFEARGLIFGAPLAIELGVPFVPLRKPKKLPGETPAP